MKTGPVRHTAHHCKEVVHWMLIDLGAILFFLDNNMSKVCRVWPLDSNLGPESHTQRKISVRFWLTHPDL